tara:strand:- start:1510 stop:1665 length:156 start_codon:yes stop_codon:yes gene_type:complete
MIPALISTKTSQRINQMSENAELQNGRWAMLGIIAAIGSYAVTGQIIPGVF